jgi:toxin CptA
MRSSHASPTCRLEWRPSRWRAACIVVVSLLAAVAWQLTALPAEWAAVAGLAGLGWAARRVRLDLAEPALELAWPAGDEGAEATGPGGTFLLANVTVRWRGALATLEGRDAAGKLRRLAWWPDTLPPASRRALRLATDRRPAPPRVPLLST